MVELRYGKARAAVKETGAELASYVAKDGREYIWTGDPAVWPGHSPVLFPVVGSTTDGKVRIGGVSYEIPKHGYPRHEEFQLAKHGEDFAEFTYTAGEESLRKYPFRFMLHVVHTIWEEGFTTKFLVENQDDKDMPFCIGGHPGFTCPMREGESFSDYIVKFECVEDGENTLCPGGAYLTGTEYLPGFRDSDTLHLDYALFDARDALIFDKLKSRKVWLLHEKTGKGIEFAFPKFDLLGIWTMPNKRAPYVCLEPWSGLPAKVGESGNFEDKPYVRWLKPGESYQTGYTMRIVE